MTTTQQTIAVSDSPGVMITLESTGIFLGILVSVSVLAGLGIKIVTSINQISLSIKQIKEDLKEHADNAKKIEQLDRKLDLHLQEYVNRKDVVQMIFGQINEKTDHKFKKLLFYVRDIQSFLQRDSDFKIREYYEYNSNEE